MLDFFRLGRFLAGRIKKQKQEKKGTSGQSGQTDDWTRKRDHRMKRRRKRTKKAPKIGQRRPEQDWLVKVGSRIRRFFCVCSAPVFVHRISAVLGAPLADCGYLFSAFPVRGWLRFRRLPLLPRSCCDRFIFCATRHIGLLQRWRAG